LEHRRKGNQYQVVESRSPLSPERGSGGELIIVRGGGKREEDLPTNSLETLPRQEYGPDCGPFLERKRCTSERGFNSYFIYEKSMGEKEQEKGRNEGHNGNRPSDHSLISAVVP